MDGIKKIDDVIEIITLLEEKNEKHKNAILNNIKVLENELSYVSDELEKSPETDCNVLIKRLSEQLLKKKPLANINILNKKIYKYISKLGKRLDKLKTFPNRSISLCDIKFDQKALKEAIAEYIVHYSVDNKEEVDDTALDKICDELGLVESDKVKEKIIKMRDLPEIEKLVSQRKTAELLNWVNKNEESLIKSKSAIPILTYQIYIIEKSMKTANKEEIIDICRFYFKKFSDQNENLIAKFLTALIYTNKHKTDDNINTNGHGNEAKSEFLSKIDKHYTEFLDLESKWQTLERIYKDDIYRMYDVPKKDPLYEVFRAGVGHYSKFMKLGELYEKNINLDEVDLDIEIDKEFTYHNIIVCPVSKELCNHDNPPVLLTCGHVISDASAKKLANIDINSYNRMFKCPVCPHQSQYSELRMIKMDD